MSRYNLSYLEVRGDMGIDEAGIVSINRKEPCVRGFNRDCVGCPYTRMSIEGDTVGKFRCINLNTEDIKVIAFDVDMPVSPTATLTQHKLMAYHRDMVLWEVTVPSPMEKETTTIAEFNQLGIDAVFFTKQALQNQIDAGVISLEKQALT